MGSDSESEEAGNHGSTSSSTEGNAEEEEIQIHNNAKASNTSSSTLQKGKKKAKSRGRSTTSGREKHDKTATDTETQTQTMPPYQSGAVMPMQYPFGVINQPLQPGAGPQGGQPQQQMFVPVVYQPQMMMPQGGAPYMMMTTNGAGTYARTSTNSFQLSNAAITMLSTIHAAAESFLGSNEAEESDAKTINKRRHNNVKVNKDSSSETTKLVIEIRKSRGGAILGSSINIESIDDDTSNNNADATSDNDEGEVLPSPSKNKRRRTNNNDVVIEGVESGLGPNPSLKDLEDYVHELFKQDIERNSHIAIESEEGALSNEEKLAKAQELMSGKDIPHYNCVLWDDRFYELLHEVATHKSWMFKMTTQSQVIRNWVKEQKYRYRNTFMGATRKIDRSKGGNVDELQDEEDDDDTPRRGRALLTQERYERLYNVAFPFPKMKAAEGKALSSVLILKPPFPPKDQKTWV